MSGEKSLDSFDEVNAFTVTLETDDTAAQDTLHDALADRDEWDAAQDDGVLHVRGAGTEDGLRNLLQALTDIDPDTITITAADTDEDADKPAETDEEDVDASDEAADDTEDEPDETPEDEPAPADEKDESAEDADTEDEEEEDTAAADEGTDNDTATDDDTATDEAEAANTTAATAPDADTPGALLTAYMEEHGAAVIDADTAIDTLDLDIDDADGLRDLLQLDDETAFIADETGYDTDTVEELLDADQDELDAEHEEVTGLIEQLETVKETGEDQLSALQPDDIDDELAQLREKQERLTEQLEQIDAVQDAADAHATLAEQADRLEDALTAAAETLETLELTVIGNEDTATVLLPGTAGSPGALTAVLRRRLATTLDTADAVTDYSVSPDNPVTAVEITHDTTVSTLQDLIHDGVAGGTPTGLAYTVHAYSARTGTADG